MLLQPHMYSVFREQDCFRDFYLSIMKIILFQILDVQNVPSVFYLYIAFDLTLIPPLKVVGFPVQKICKAKNKKAANQLFKKALRSFYVAKPRINIVNIDLIYFIQLKHFFNETFIISTVYLTGSCSTIKWFLFFLTCHLFLVRSTLKIK
ncbi:hypothetical protein COI61_27995 [Bacillus cereus]|nr:hypothetical protein COI61_27995 [Bacillus cereus]